MTFFVKRALFFPMVIVLGTLSSFVAAQDNADALCPDAATAIDGAPASTTGIQSDIERLNLCVQRAALLQKLDEIASKREEVVRKALNPDSDQTNSGMRMDNVPIPPLPVSALPAVRDINDKAALPRDRVTQGSPFDTAAKAEAVAASVAPAPLTGRWAVRKIWGQGGTMRAQISNGGGMLLNVVKGDALPGGETVDTISIKGVTISQNGKISDLEWEQVSSAGPKGTGN